MSLTRLQITISRSANSLGTRRRESSQPPGERSISALEPCTGQPCTRQPCTRQPCTDSLHGQQPLHKTAKENLELEKTADKINQSHEVLITKPPGFHQNGRQELTTSTQKKGQSTKKGFTHLIPEQQRGSFRYVRMLSLNPDAFVRTSRHPAPNPARWICRNNAITDAAEHRQLHYRTGAWVSSLSSHFRDVKMMPEL